MMKPTTYAEATDAELKAEIWDYQNLLEDAEADFDEISARYYREALRRARRALAARA
jgi:hypothetical protein